MNVYDECPVFSNERFILRKVTFLDSEALLKVYSDTLSVPLFNSDNCEGDDFYYRTLERMNKAIAFWLFSYDQKYFVRWAVEVKGSGEVIGTIENFHRDSFDFFTDCVLLRLDLRSDFETVENIKSILSLIINPSFELFNASMIATKCIPAAKERRTALEAFGFCETDEKLIGNNGTAYSDYYFLKK